MRPLLVVLAVLAAPAAAQPDPPRTEVGALYVLSIGGSTDRALVRGDAPGTGGGGALAVWHWLGEGLGVRARAGGFQVAIPQERAIRYDPHRFRTADLAVALRFEHRVGALRGSMGPQVGVGWWELEAPEDLAAFYAREGVEVTDNTGVLWRADLALELAAALPGGVSAWAGIDLPLVPRSRWGRFVEVDLERSTGPVLERRYVPVPRVGLGVSVRLR